MGIPQHNSIPPPSVIDPAMERVCPGCGTRFGPAQDPRALETCPNDGLALVSSVEWDRSSGDPLLGRTIAGRFVVMGRIGSGSMGAVYRAWQPTMGRWVALKVMRYDRVSDAEARARFEREARAMSQLISPNTVRVYDFGQAEDGSVYLSMELLEGESLGARLKRVKRLPLPQAIQVAKDALLSLAEAHAKGIIHRDLKPDNLFLAQTPDASGGSVQETCKLLDFGIAKVIREEQVVDALETQAGTVFGTPRYMSPEQAQGKKLDPRTDLYSLGVILYQMVTGVPPFDDDDAVVVMAAHIKTKPRPLAQVAPDVQVPENLERVIIRALAKDPDDRPSTADIFIRALDAVEYDAMATIPPAARSGMRHLPGGPDSNPLPTLAPSAVKRRRLALGLSAFVILLLLFIVWWKLPSATSHGPQVQAQASAASGPSASTIPEDQDDTTFSVEAPKTAESSAVHPADAGTARAKPRHVVRQPHVPKHAPPAKTSAGKRLPAQPTATGHRQPKRYERFE